MKKRSKLITTILVSIGIYIGFYYLAKFYPNLLGSYNSLSVFIISVIFTFIGVILSFFLKKYIQKKKISPSQKNTLELAFAVLWWANFGWISICGIAIGSVLAEKPEKKVSKRLKNVNILRNLDNHFPGNFIFLCD